MWQQQYRDLQTPRLQVHQAMPIFCGTWVQNFPYIIVLTPTFLLLLQEFMKVHGPQQQSIHKIRPLRAVSVNVHCLCIALLQMCSSSNPVFAQLIQHSFILLACAESDDSVQFSGAASIPPCYTPFPSPLFDQLVFNPPSPHLAIYFMAYLSALLFPNTYVVLFLCDFYFLPFSVYAQTNVIYLLLFSLIVGFLSIA